MAEQHVANPLVTFAVLLWPEAEGGFSVTVPSLPGCVTQAESEAEALERAEDVIRLFVAELESSGEEVPVEAAAPLLRTVVIS